MKKILRYRSRPSAAQPQEVPPDPNPQEVPAQPHDPNPSTPTEVPQPDPMPTPGNAPEPHAEENSCGRILIIYRRTRWVIRRYPRS